MKRILVYLSLAVAVAMATAWSQSNPMHTRNPLFGTWELSSQMLDGQANDPKVREVKMISPERYMWVAYEKSSMKPSGMGLGSCKLDGDSYTEHIEYLNVNGRDMSDMIGKDYTFTVKVDGDTLTQSGTMGTMKLSESWKRVK